MQTRLPARLPAPKLLSLAHVISLEQSGEEGIGEEEEEEEEVVDGWRPGAGCWGADLGLIWGEDLAQRVWVHPGTGARDQEREILKWRSGRG